MQNIDRMWRRHGQDVLRSTACATLSLAVLIVAGGRDEYMVVMPDSVRYFTVLPRPAGAG